MPTTTISTGEENILNDFVDNTIAAFSAPENLKKLELSEVLHDVVTIHRTPSMVVTMQGWKDSYPNNSGASRMSFTGVIAYYAANVSQPWNSIKLRAMAGKIRKILHGNQNTGVNGFGFNPQTEAIITEAKDLSSNNLFQTIYIRFTLEEYIG